MTEEITALTGREPPPVRDWISHELKGTGFDPVLAGPTRESRPTRVRLPHGESWAWPATRHDDIKMISNDARFGRAKAVGRQVTRLAPHFRPRPGSLAFADRPDHDRPRRTPAVAFTVAAMKWLRPRAQEILDVLVDGLVRKGPPADLVERVLEPSG